MSNSLTGRRRFRIWKNKIILQVEYSYFMDDSFSPSIESRKAYDWRDATLEDLTIDTDVHLRVGNK